MEAIHISWRPCADAKVEIYEERRETLMVEYLVQNFFFCTI